MFLKFCKFNNHVRQLFAFYFLLILKICLWQNYSIRYLDNSHTFSYFLKKSIFLFSCSLWNFQLFRNNLDYFLVLFMNQSCIIALKNPTSCFMSANTINLIACPVYSQSSMARMTKTQTRLAGLLSTLVLLYFLCGERIIRIYFCWYCSYCLRGLIVYRSI